LTDIKTGKIGLGPFSKVLSAAPNEGFELAGFPQALG
jgi:hypothetical protein